MAKVTLVVKRNASYETGVYGLSVHDQPGAAANVIPINSEDELRDRLLGFGISPERAKALIGQLRKKHDDIRIEVEKLDSN